MGFFSKIVDFFKKLFDKIMKILKKVLEIIKDNLPFIIIALVVFAPVLLPMVATWLPAGMAGFATTLGSVGTWVGTLTAGELWSLALGTSFILAPTQTAEVLGKTVDAVVEVGKDVVSGAVDLVDTGVQGLLSSKTFLWIAGLAGAYLWLSSGGSDDPTLVVTGGVDETITSL